MNKPAMEDFYDRLRSTKASAPSPASQKKLREQWLADIRRLFSKVTEWLQPGADEKLLRIESDTIEIVEESLGTYTAPRLTIYLPKGIKVRVEPVGMEVLAGHTGRVDLISGPSKGMLLREDEGAWVLATPAIQFGRRVFDLVPLTQETLSKALTELLP